ncbi:potassium efflux system KefA protein [Bacillus sp. JCM 19046]|uniref:Small conductance mechanosensitive channel n=1 Tax=Shouchella xiaoxiensis TaxID=766895 RepID=A0ABS2SVY2_9BACI|nr:mechanosensitive ion channel family protein [Shouchella xiaoxiensis]MBM7839691.1 small conductance mechanosensitive channel [Shouchella xiaoxiensis]GAF16401.1 potassium efflux system KefA protein [Bacillus sp. JCM 19046]
MFEDLWNSTYALLSDTGFWLTVIGTVIKIAVILLLANIVLKVLKRVISKSLQRREGKYVKLSEQRSQTLISLLHSVVANIIYFVAILLVLDELGFSLTSVLVGAGVLGLAVGFGAQNVVRDVITGFFILYEDQFSVGDFITTGNYTGTVIEFGLRVTKIQDWTGEVNIIPNGHIEDLKNYSRENSYAVVDMRVSYKQDIETAQAFIQQAALAVFEKNDNMIEKPDMLGVQEFNESGAVIRVIALSKPVMQWSVEREIRRAILDTFAEEGIEVPYQQVTVHQKERVS